ncbi:hypothetical protein AGMMS50262_20420 [Bacteroidia bacterium]|nr:hypothetical protein AGMMS50262_20420 [Bacteroidia bacterium]
MNKLITSIMKNPCWKYIIGFVLIVGLTWVIIKTTESHASKLTDDTLKYVEKVKQEGIKTDSDRFSMNLKAQVQLESLPPQKKDSLYIRLMTDLNENHNSNLTNILADMRQEYNSQVTLLNNWVAIWVAVLGFLGLVWPLIVSYMFKQNTDKLEGDFRREIDKYKEDIELSKCAIHISTSLSCVKDMKEYRIGAFYSLTGMKQFLLIFELLNQHTDKLIDTIRNREQGEIPKEILYLYVLQYKSLLSELELLYTHNYILGATINIEKLRELLDQILLQLDNANCDKNDLANNIQKISNYWNNIKVILKTQIESIMQ